jgi:hypothetical protein
MTDNCNYGKPREGENENTSSINVETKNNERILSTKKENNENTPSIKTGKSENTTFAETKKDENTKILWRIRKFMKLQQDLIMNSYQH